ARLRRARRGERRGRGAGARVGPTALMRPLVGAKRAARARLPAGCEEPRFRSHDRRRVGAYGRVAIEAVEPGGRRARIDRARGRSVLEAVPEDVDQALANLRRRPERPRVVAIAPQSAGAAGGPVDDAGDARREPLDTAR